MHRLRISLAWILTFTFALIGVAIGALQVLARSIDSVSESEKLNAQFTRIEQNWLSATAANDRTTLERMIGDDFIGTAFGGNIVHKDDLLPQDTTRQLDQSWATARVQDIDVHGYINSAVVVGRVAMQDPKRPGFRFTKVYMKRQGRWQLVAAHLSHVNNP
jgi:hypothetical protein